MASVPLPSHLPSSALLAPTAPVVGPTEAQLRWSRLERIINRYLAAPSTPRPRVLAADRQGNWYIAKIETRCAHSIRMCVCVCFGSRMRCVCVLRIGASDPGCLALRG
jgi:hypothetical protein